MALTKHEVLSEFRTASLLRAASDLFAARGFAGTTVEEIARAAEVAKGTVYLYFPSKEELYRAAFVRNIEELKERSLAALRRPVSIEEKLLEFISTKLTYFEEHQAFFAVYFAEMSACAGSARLQEFLDASWREQVEALAVIVEEAIGAGKIRRVPARAAASALFGLTRSTVIQRTRERSAPAEEDARLVFDLLWKGLAAP